MDIFCFAFIYLQSRQDFYERQRRKELTEFGRKSVSGIRKDNAIGFPILILNTMQLNVDMEVSGLEDNSLIL